MAVGLVATNAALANITAALAAYASVPKYVTWGTGSTTPAKTDTALANPASETAATGTVTRQTTNKTNDTLRIVATLVADGTKTISEAGWWDAASSGNLCGRSVFAPIGLRAGDSIIFTINCVYSQVSSAYAQLVTAFTRATAVVIAAVSAINPYDGSWYWVTNSPWNADNTGATSANGAIQDCIDDAAIADKNVYLPAGTYLFTGGYVGAPTDEIVPGSVYITRPAYNNMKVAGAGVGVTTVTCANTLSTSLFYWYRGQNIHLSDLSIYTPAPTGIQAVPHGIYFAGMTNSSVRRVRLDNFRDSLRLAGLYPAETVGQSTVVDNIVVRGATRLAFQVMCMENSMFSNMDLENTVDGGEGMPIYDERRNAYNTYENITCAGGYRSCMQFSSDRTIVAEASHDITVTNLTLNMLTTTHDNYALTFYALTDAVRHYNINIYNLVMNVVPSNTECIRWSDGHNIVIDGVTAVGGKCLNAGYSDSVLTSCQIKNGTYDGTYINTVYPAGTHGDIGGLTVSNITLI